MDESVSKFKSSGITVFRIKYQGNDIYFREPTIGEKRRIDEAIKSQSSTINIIRSIIIKIDGNMTIEEVLTNAGICDSILGNIVKQAPFFNDEKTIELYNKAKENVENNIIDRFKTWIARELSFPEFVYLADDMTSIEFMKYIKFAEEYSGLEGMFLYFLTNNEEYLTDGAKAEMQRRQGGEGENQPDWARAGLSQPPRNIREQKQVQQMLQEEKQSGKLNNQGVKQDTPNAPAGKTSAGKSIDQMTQESIRQASAMLSSKIKQEENLKAQGKNIPRFNWREDQGNDEI